MYTYLVRINESVNIVEAASFGKVFHHDHNNVHNKIKEHKGVYIEQERERASLIVSATNEAPLQALLCVWTYYT